MRGFANIKPPPSLSLPGLPTIDFGGVAGTVPYYFLTLAVISVCLMIMYRLEKSQIGDTFKAIYSQDLLAGCVGINVNRYKTMAFVIGSFFAGIAGVLLAHRLGAIDPRQFTLETALYVLVWVIVGGIHTFAGPIIGVSFLTGIGEFTRAFVMWRPLIFGFILIITLRFLPEGLEGFTVGPKAA